MKDFKNNQEKESRSEAMGKDPVWRLLFHFSGPALISMTVASTYNLVDAIFVGRLGAGALAAMTVTYPLLLSFIAVASGTAVGVTSLISRCLGAGEKKSADMAACVSITLCFILSAVIAFVCLPNIESILVILGAGDVVLPLATKYTSILIKFVIFSFLFMILGSIIRADGNPVFTSSVGVFSSIMNIILDPVFIFGFGPIPAMGISGAATATVIAQAISTIIYLIYILLNKTGYEFRPAYFLPYPKVIADIYRIGVASIVRSGVQFLVMGVINRKTAFFGVIPLAVIGILIRMGRFVQMPSIGLGQGLLPLIGYNYGARKKERVAELVLKAAISGITWSVLCWTIIMLFPGLLMNLFNSDPAFLKEGIPAVRIYFICIFILGVQMIPGFFFQGIGKGLPATILSSAKHIFFLLPMVLLLPRLYGLKGLWISFPIADILTFLLGIFWVSMEFRRQGIFFK
ncbi:MATE family efflux transporter [Thermodesulfobacteriota bacterium]